MATITDVRAWSAPALEEIFDATRQQGDVLLELDANLGDNGKLSDWEGALPPAQPQSLSPCRCGVSFLAFRRPSSQPVVVSVVEKITELGSRTGLRKATV